MSIEKYSPRPVLSVVVPLFNEQEAVPELVRRVTESCRSLKVTFEFIVVNDGSSDETQQRLVAASRETAELRVVGLFRNFGHMAALSAGVALAQGEGVVVLDGDLQDPPELIPRFYAQWRAGADVVYGLRTSSEGHPVKKAGTSFFYWLLQKVTETPIPAQAGTFCLMDRKVVDVLNRLPEKDRYFAGLRAWVGGTQSVVTYDRPARFHGRSRVGARGLFRLARTALISFSKTPLRYASFLSLWCAGILFLIGLTAIGIRLFTHLAVPGWATTTALIGMMGFVQSLVLAILSEYVAVVFEEVKSRPLFLVRDEFVGGESVKR